MSLEFELNCEKHAIVRKLYMMASLSVDKGHIVQSQCPAAVCVLPHSQALYGPATGILHTTMSAYNIIKTCNIY